MNPIAQRCPVDENVGPTSDAIAREKYLHATSDFWRYPDKSTPASVKEYSRKSTQRLPMVNYGPKSIKISRPLRAKLRHIIPAEQSRSFELFSHPDLIKECFVELLDLMDLSTYSGFIGLDIQGAALAIYAALEANFQGRVIFYKPEYGLVPPQRDMSNEIFILIQLLLETGRSALEVWELIESLNGNLSAVLSFKSLVSWQLFNLRATALKELTKKKVHLFTIS